jgi:hypothetical protein
MPCTCCHDDDDLPLPPTRVWRSDVPEAPPKRHRTRSHRRPPPDSVRRTMRDFATPRLQWGPAQPAQRTEAICLGGVCPDAMTASKSRERIARLQGTNGGHNGP